MEEIDIIELLKRVKEGKAPKRIEIDGKKYFLRDLENPILDELYCTEDKIGLTIGWIVCIDTKIKILDKPIIKKLSKVNSLDDNRALIIENRYKLNEIIDILNKENKDE